MGVYKTNAEGVTEIFNLFKLHTEIYLAKCLS